MQPVFEFKAVLDTVLVYPHMIVLRPGKFRKLGQDPQDREIRYQDIADIHLREAGLMTGGFIHFALHGEADPSPPSLLKAGNDANTFGFSQGKNSEAIQIRNYILAQMKNPPPIQDMAASSEPAEHKLQIPPSPCNSQDFDRYRTLTAEKDWVGISSFNTLPKAVLGVTKELNVLHRHLQDGEVVFAFVAGMLSQTTTSNLSDIGINTWLGVLTDRRVLLLDHALLTDSVDTQSIRHDRIQAVSSSQGWMFGKITIDIGNRSVVIDNCDKEHVKTFARIANDWLEHLAAGIQAESPKPQASPAPQQDPVEAIRQLAELKAAGILSEEEFTRAKASILSKM